MQPDHGETQGLAIEMNSRKKTEGLLRSLHYSNVFTGQRRLYLRLSVKRLLLAHRDHIVWAVVAGAPYIYRKD